MASATPLDNRAKPHNTIFISHSRCRQHDPGPGTLDRPTRLDAVFTTLDQEKFKSLTRATAQAASRECLLRIHTSDLVERLQNATPERGYARFGNDIFMNSSSLEAAFLAAGGAISAIDAVLTLEWRNAFVATRPPGHHASANQSMGFCFFNNAALAAAHARHQYGVERIAIVDFDVHHGNGIQEIFWSDKNTLYASTHQMPLYPGSGEINETGAFNNIVNAPLRRGDSGIEFRQALLSRILPKVRAFSPELIILCAGFDAHKHDPLGGLRLVEEDFRDVTLRLMEIAAHCCHDRIVSLLEGGYEPQDLANSVAAHVSALMDV